MIKYPLFAVIFVVGAALLGLPQADSKRPTLRDVLAADGTVDLRDFQDMLLDARFPDPEPGRRFVHVDVHINPSAERLLVFSTDYKLVRELWGWKVAMLPDDVIVYHHNQVHFSRSRELELSVFDPPRNADRPVYPPAVVSSVRQQFAARVAAAYQTIGEEWFRKNNYPMDAERFNASLIGQVSVDAAAGAMTFRVEYGGEPLTFSQIVAVSCAPLAPIDAIRCSEAPAGPSPAPH